MACQHSSYLTFTIFCNLVKLVTFYELKPIQLGCEVHSIDLGNPLPENVIETIKKDVTEHRILIFKNQRNISPDKHVEIGRWFGELESTSFYKHPKSPSLNIFRVSNDASEGQVGVGNTGWHIDGQYLQKPCSYSIYHMVNISRGAETLFAPLNDIIEGLSHRQRHRWERLWVVRNPHGTDVIHPLIYSHPESGKKVLCLHTGLTGAFYWDRGNVNQRLTNMKETQALKKEIDHVFTKDKHTVQYSHKWEPGDFIISDNLALAHVAPPSSQRRRSEVGLRVLHRVTVAGKESPTKKYDLSQLKQKKEL
ncbi:alpha-ketoglutarate-dependent taurine dioxygenase-like [Saccoglossus kowalevskii]|uniref:Uncharacterized protein LOC100366611 n=1 Tax=Saccoglossus kowalevskii TaxID=10224 RepID=A0ABM0GSA8_SACKO|nr:PREDICTED: uncharacterized protein LOC100366611 [Saccoglossus kowalevskii]